MHTPSRIVPPHWAALAAGALVLTACAQVPPSAGEAATAPATGAAAPVAAATPAARSGRLTIVQWPNVQIDGRPMRAAPGARILNTNNLTVTPNMVPPDTQVSYELDGIGQIRLLRILPAARPGEGQVRTPGSTPSPRH